MNRRSFIASLAAVLAVPKMLFAAKPKALTWTMAPSICACCLKPTKDAVVHYDRARFGKIAGKPDNYAQLEWGQSTTLCRECDDHRGLLKARRYTSVPSYGAIQSEMLAQEGDQTPEGFYVPLPPSYTFLCHQSRDTLLLPFERGGDGPFRVDIQVCDHMKPGEWALIPNHGGNRAVSS